MNIASTDVSLMELIIVIIVSHSKILTSNKNAVSLFKLSSMSQMMLLLRTVKKPLFWIRVAWMSLELSILSTFTLLFQSQTHQDFSAHYELN